MALACSSTGISWATGPHTVAASADGMEFARAEVTVTTLGTEFRRGLSRVIGVPDFPQVGTDVVLQWQEAQQNFVIIYELPTQRLVEVTPTLALPAGVQLPDATVASLYSEIAEVRASPEPTLLLAEDAGGLVLLALANMEGGLLGEERGKVEVSVASTVVTLVGLAAGISVSAMTPSVVDAIVNHSHYPTIQSAISMGIVTDRHFLEHIADESEIVRLIGVVADGLSHSTARQKMAATLATGSQARTTGVLLQDESQYAPMQSLPQTDAPKNPRLARGVRHRRGHALGGTRHTSGSLAGSRAFPHRTLRSD